MGHAHVVLTMTGATGTDDNHPLGRCEDCYEVTPLTLVEDGVARCRRCHDAHLMPKAKVQETGEDDKESERGKDRPRHGV